MGRATTLRAAAVAVGLAAALLLAELALALVGWQPAVPGAKVFLAQSAPMKRFFHCYPEPGPGLEAAPVLEGTWTARHEGAKQAMPPAEAVAGSPWCVEYLISAEGFRIDPSATPRKGRRIGLVGDSFTVGEGLGYDDTLGAQLEELLDQRVMTLGRSGASAEDAAATIEQGMERGWFRRAVYVFVPNDIWLPDALKAEKRAIGWSNNLREPELGFAGQLRLTRLVARAVALRQARDATLALYGRAYDPAHNPEGLARLERALAAMARHPVAVVLYPFLVDLDAYPLTSVHEAVAARARDAGLPVLDLAVAFAGHDEAALHVQAVDRHPNGQAHAIAAGAVASWLGEPGR